MISRMKLTKDLVAASATPLVLAILAEGESYGYAIIQRVRELSGGQTARTDGMLYPVLHPLEAQGSSAARWRESASGRRRKYYTLQRPGRQALKEQKQQWLTVHETLIAALGRAGLSGASLGQLIENQLMTVSRVVILGYSEGSGDS